ncbi:hypothetical protein [Paenibacillus sp. FSL R5-0519]|uniref:hypothetical protein n=1 Tax=Paenibacillus sp. FSL R5-0519 TaxID=2921648 RepID=UPI0030DA7275
MKDVISRTPYLNALPEEVKELLIRLGTDAIRFTSWFFNNQNKIISKLRGAKTKEDRYDVLTELRCAAFLLSLSEIVELQYEPLHQIKRSPDFKAITITDGEVYFEVRRIRKTLTESKRDQFVELFWKKAKENIRLNFGLSLNTSSIETAESFEQLNQRIDELIDYIISVLSELSEDLEEPIELILDDFANGLEVYISSVPKERRTNNEIRKYGGLFRTPYSGHEDRKFGDIIFEKTHQLLDNEKNIIFIYADNETHEIYDMIDSISSINQIIRQASGEFILKKGYSSIVEFLAKSRRISGIFLLTNNQERNFWENKNSIKAIDNKLINELEGRL